MTKMTPDHAREGGRSKAVLARQNKAMEQSAADAAKTVSGNPFDAVTKDRKGFSSKPEPDQDLSRKSSGGRSRREAVAMEMASAAAKNAFKNPFDLVKKDTKGPKSTSSKAGKVRRNKPAVDHVANKESGPNDLAADPVSPFCWGTAEASARVIERLELPPSSVRYVRRL